MHCKSQNGSKRERTRVRGGELTNTVLPRLNNMAKPSGHLLLLLLPEQQKFQQIRLFVGFLNHDDYNDDDVGATEPPPHIDRCDRFDLSN